MLVRGALFDLPHTAGKVCGYEVSWTIPSLVPYMQTVPCVEGDLHNLHSIQSLDYTPWIGHLFKVILIGLFT